MTINDFAFACAIDGSMPYFTYENNAMLIIQSANDAKSFTSGFMHIEPYMPALISHESLHVIMKDMIGAEASDSLDDLEVIVARNGARFQVTLNNMLFASDNSGIVVP